jgi:hypothetical protein
VLLADLRDLLVELLRGHDEPALSGDRFAYQAGDLALELGCGPCLVDLVSARHAAVWIAHVEGASVAVREVHLVCLRKWAEPRLVGHLLGGERHGHHRPAVERVHERERGRPLREVPRYLDRVLDRLSAGVEYRRFRQTWMRSHLGELLREPDISLVGGDHEARVHELLSLLLDRCDDLLGRVPYVRNADPAAHVDERVAVDVVEQRARGVVDVHWLADADGLRHIFLLQLAELDRLRSWDLSGHD